MGCPACVTKQPGKGYPDNVCLGHFQPQPFNVSSISISQTFHLKHEIFKPVPQNPSWAEITLQTCTKMTPQLSGPGLLYVNSSIIRPDLLSESAFLQWYSQDHIPEIIATSGISSAFRFKALSSDSPKSYLTLYPMKDLAFLQSEEFKKIRVNSDLLLGGGPVYDLAEFDMRYY